MINHNEIIDGFSELQDHKNYLSFNSYCGICDDKILVTPENQKYLLEEKKVPVKMLKRGALFCNSCSKRRARINYLRKGNQFLEEKNGRANLNELEKEENELERMSKSLYLSAEWPY